MNGARTALLRLKEDIEDLGRIKGDELVYFLAEMELALNDLENADKYISGAKIGYRNHIRNKKKKLIKCEAYFLDNYLCNSGMHHTHEKHCPTGPGSPKPSEDGKSVTG